MSISPEMRTQIEAELAAIEATEEVVILYACESGSRAWGFPSPDSDYDVRFIYARPEDWYLSLFVEQQRDVIERPVDAVLDLGGWDIRKALKLMAGANAPLLEWLQSPIVYRAGEGGLESIRPMMAPMFSPPAVGFHYRSLARKAFEGFKGTGSLKRLCYALRSVLAATWVHRGLGVPPMTLEALMAGVDEAESARADIEALVALKARSDEKAQVAPEGPVPDLVAVLSQNLDEAEFARPARDRPTDQLDPLFRDLVRGAR